MTILEVIEYKEERVAVVEDTRGKFIYSESNPNPVALYDTALYVRSYDRDRLLL